ncbi:MAG: formimidoylglutamate deiminase [Alphaproteobacteria bacterium]|nr:formimidoylglutamate deiminase [Alphaproteobacteria bacterium]MBU1516746.1 formimidoylglutamate deiminase [Alphaproteobacteria bacterium]MBU2092440.1 formimidoylglutamate deiminase [Alphaproteobacteria bacterium]MBU2152706.1 formimidoylglutamate deiminase [Alphaproteobacteria bacterium]MBU2305640.1 formimidoylglutamate deiminase [Alphaproteobacteria bacterium]
MTQATLWFANALLAEGWARDVRLELADGRIAGIATGVAAAPGDDRHAIGLPGLPNLHSHAFQRAMAGLTEVRGPEGDSFWTWRELMYRFVERLGPEQVEAVAAMAFLEMLETGFTRVGEFHYLHHDVGGAAFANPAEMAERVAAAADETGIGLTLLPVFYAHAGFGGQAPTEGQRRFLSTPDSYARLLEGSRVAVGKLAGGKVGVAPHSLRAVTEAELAEITSGASGPIHIHIAEQIREVEDCQAWSGAAPVEWLLDRFPVDGRWCLIHATHMTSSETQRLARSGAVAGLCPITEANLGDGLFPAPAFLAAGGAFGVGSDSNVRIDAAEELRTLEYGQRLAHRSRNVLASEAGRSTGAELYRRALIGGARALGEVEHAGLAVGGPADLVSLSADHADLAARDGDAWLDSLVFARGAGAIDGVWRAGRQVVEQGRHRARSRIVARYRAALEGLVQ